MYFIVDDEFPPAEKANRYGLLCMGGNLKSSTILKAYRFGIFPWFNEDEPIQWWSPNPRMVLFPNEFHCSHSFKTFLKNNNYVITCNKAFTHVMEECRNMRVNTEGTWISSAIIEAYSSLFSEGYGRSIEVWENENLVGGLYGLQMGNVFFGESMFSKKSNTSKLALYHLCQGILGKEIKLIDCQVENQHLIRMGAKQMQRNDFLEILKQWI